MNLLDLEKQRPAEVTTRVAAGILLVRWTPKIYFSTTVLPLELKLHSYFLIIICHIPSVRLSSVDGHERQQSDLRVPRTQREPHFVEYSKRTTASETLGNFLGDGRANGQIWSPCRLVGGIKVLMSY